MDIKSIDFETRVALENITKVGNQDGAVVFIDSALANWQYVSAAKFGKLIDKLTDDEKAELLNMPKDKAVELGKRARIHYENPSQG